MAIRIGPCLEAVSAEAVNCHNATDEFNIETGELKEPAYSTWTSLASGLSSLGEWRMKRPCLSCGPEVDAILPLLFFCCGKRIIHEEDCGWVVSKQEGLGRKAEAQGGFLSHRDRVWNGIYFARRNACGKPPNACAIPKLVFMAVAHQLSIMFAWTVRHASSSKPLANLVFVQYYCNQSCRLVGMAAAPVWPS